MLVLGLTFKEHCPDLRDYRVQVDVHDPLASAEEAQHEYGLALAANPGLALMTPSSWPWRTAITFTWG